jgi:DNA repair exonuclease SbcCD ATPase subunit
MKLSETELTIGGVKLKGIYIAVVLSLATTIASAVWTASSLYSRLAIVEKKASAVKATVEKVQLIEQRLEDNDVGQLKGKLATLKTSLDTLVVQQKNLLELKGDVSELSKDIESIKGTVAKAEVITKDVGDVGDSLKELNTEVDNLWEGLEYLSNPLK